MRRLKVGCVGTGFIAGRHLAALASFGDVDVVAVADPLPGRAEAAAVAHDARAYEDGLALMEGEELDALWICVPPFAHGELERAAIERGLPFLVEKPLANDLDTAVDIAERVQSSGVLAAVGYHWRYLSIVEKAAALLAGSAPSLVSGHWLDSTPPVSWWIQRQLSGGQVVEQTTHLFDLARLLVGEVDLVSAVEVPAGDADQVPVASSAALRFASGAVGTIASARVLPVRHRVGLQLVADGCAVELSERSLSDHELRVVTAGGEEVHSVKEDPIAAEDRAFLDAVAGESDDVRAPYADALCSHLLSWAADRSAREGVPVVPSQEIAHG
uniref:Oxidoreductase domain protein n=1 Tax=uncultured Nocardioidaceae bacterium TaxID=253824 RepID=A0A6J4M4Q0_9ACTN|nr:MAG: oxidoreductase domain protein [uncultured Nocardioidaceae bacterium]